MDGIPTGTRRVAGTRQALRAIRNGEAKRVLLAEDAAPSIVRELSEAAEAAGVPVETTPTMAALGRACRLQVGTAAVAVIED